jgi:hypothetical protein
MGLVHIALFDTATPCVAGDAYVFHKHADFERVVGSATKVTFHWAPYPPNATDLFNKWSSEDTRPDLIVSTTSLWHILHTHDAAAYKSELAALSTAAAKLGTSTKPPLMLLASGTEVFSNQILSVPKRRYMTGSAVDAYNAEMVGSQALAPTGPFGLLDLFRLTWGEQAVPSDMKDLVYVTVIWWWLNVALQRFFLLVQGVGRNVVGMACTLMQRCILQRCRWR